MRPIDQLANVPLVDLDVGDAAFRRKLERAGYSTLVEAFDASDDEMDRKLSRDLATLDKLDALKELYESNPESFVAGVLTGSQEVSSRTVIRTAHERSDQTVSERAPRSRIHTQIAPTKRDGMSHTNGHVFTLSEKAIGSSLLAFESRAKESLDMLADRGTEYLAFEALEDFVTELDGLSQAFKTLFNRYRKQIRVVFDTIAVHLPNAFIVFCAGEVRDAYEGGNLWGNFFRMISISSQTSQTEFKRLMIECLEMRGMPTYGSDERDFYYFYTAMLHGGLTTDLWEDLWRKSLMPMARKASKDPYHFGRLLDGRTALTLMREAKYSPNVTVLNIINKAAESTTAPIIEAALGVARRLTDPSTSIGITMLSRAGLPDSALDALNRVRESDRSPVRVSQGTRSTRTTSERRAGDLLYLPEGSLVLDLNEGQARIIWKRSVLPEAYLGDRVDFFVNGELIRSAEVLSTINGCVIDGGSVALPPLPGYEVEIKLMHRESDDIWAEEASLEQAFTRTKPGCLEFLQMPDGSFRLRKRGDRITRTRTVAYVLKPGREVIPGPGMRPLEKRFTSVDWGDRLIWLFDLEPGSSGSIIEVESGRQLATWQEDVTVSIDKSGCLGFTGEGFDLYGVRENFYSDNESLPSINIEAADGVRVLEDLDVILICEGRRYSVRRRLMQRDGERSAAIALLLSEVAGFPSYAHRCDLVIRRKSQDIAVFTYSFAVVPVARIAIAAIDASTLEAKYQLKTAGPLKVVESDGRVAELDKGQDYWLYAPLQDEWETLTVDSVDQESPIDMNLRLAGVVVEVDDEARAVSLEHPLSFADAYELGAPKGRVTITALGSCSDRGILVMLGQRPVFYEELRRAGVHSTNIFSNRELLLKMPEDGSELPLRATIYFGNVGLEKSGWADLPLLRCREGLGFVRPQVLNASNGHILHLDAPATCELGVEVIRPATYTRDERVIFSCEIPKGSLSVNLPSWLVRRLDAHHKLWIRFSPLSLFGLPEYDYSLTIPFERN